MPGKNKGKRNARRAKSGRRIPASSDLPSTAGRGRFVPRPSLGSDTLLGLAQSQRRTLGSVIGSTITGGLGAYAEASFVLNGPFNVNGGQSATGYTKYMQFYSKCFVLGARIVSKGAVINNASSHGLNFGLTVTTNSTSLGSNGAAIVNGMCQWDVAFTIPDRLHLEQSVDVSRFLNKPQILDDLTLGGSAGANPTQVIVAHLWTEVLGGSTAVATEWISEIMFDCVFTDPIPFT